MANCLDFGLPLLLLINPSRSNIIVCREITSAFRLTAFATADIVAFEPRLSMTRKT
jgi:hypothetical protein